MQIDDSRRMVLDGVSSTHPLPPAAINEITTEDVLIPTF